MAQRGRRTPTRQSGRGGTKVMRKDNEGIIPVLARAVREVEQAAERGKVAPHGACDLPGRRAARARGADPAQGRHRARRGPQGRAAQAPRRHRHDPGQDRRPRHLAAAAARRGRRGLRRRPRPQARDAQAAGIGRPRGGRAAQARRRPRPVARAAVVPAVGHLAPARQPVPRARLLRRRAPTAPRPRRLANWELLEPLFKSFEYVGGGAVRLHDAARPDAARAPGVAADAAPGRSWSPPPRPGHRTFLLADEPGLGKTAQALLAAQAADAYPLLVVVPNVVKANWAHEVSLWTPHRTVTVIHGDGERDRRLRRHRDRQLRGARPPRRLARRPRLPRHGRRRGALHQEQDARSARQHVLELSAAHPRPHRAPAADGADRHAADQRHRGLPRDLAVPRLDRRQEAARRADEQARGHRADAGRAGLLPQRPPLA